MCSVKCAFTPQFLVQNWKNSFLLLWFSSLLLRPSLPLQLFPFPIIIVMFFMLLPVCCYSIHTPISYDTMLFCFFLCCMYPTEWKRNIDVDGLVSWLFLSHIQTHIPYILFGAIIFREKGYDNWRARYRTERVDLFSQSVSQYIKHNWYVDILLLLSSSASHRHFLAWPRLSNFMFSISFVVVVTHSNIKFSIPYLYYFILFVNISTFDSIQRLIYLLVWCPCYMVYFLYIHSNIPYQLFATNLTEFRYFTLLLLLLIFSLLPGWSFSDLKLILMSHNLNSMLNSVRLYGFIFFALMLLKNLYAYI